MLARGAGAVALPPVVHAPPPPSRWEGSLSLGPRPDPHSGHADEWGRVRSTSPIERLARPHTSTARGPRASPRHDAARRALHALLTTTLAGPPLPLHEHHAAADPRCGPALRSLPRSDRYALCARHRTQLTPPRYDRYALSARLSPREPAGPPIAQRHAQRSTHAQSSMRPRAGTHSSRGPAPSRTPRTASTCGHPGVGPRETRTGPTMRSTHPLLGHSLHSDRHRGPIPPLPSLAPHTLLARHATHLPAPRSLPETDMNSSRV
jgi:hypothetical protein